jgi:hypothetical protein
LENGFEWPGGSIGSVRGGSGRWQHQAFAGDTLSREAPQRLLSSAFVMTVLGLLLGISVWPPLREAIENRHCGRATIRL